MDTGKNDLPQNQISSTFKSFMAFSEEYSDILLELSLRSKYSKEVITCYGLTKKSHRLFQEKTKFYGTLKEV